MESINKIYNILYLVDKETYIKKMSRVRFHSIEAINNISNFVMTGPNWDNYNSKKSVQENINNFNIKFDLVIAYEIVKLINFDKINIPKCIRYNEMYNFNDTLKEIEESNVDLVICHHENDMKTYSNYYSNYHGQKNKKVIFAHNPHCAEKTVFKDYKLEKKLDFLLCGRCLAKNSLKDFHYPLRDRLHKLLEKLPKKYKWAVQKHPRYVHNDSYTNKYLIEFSKAINSTRICLTCSGIPKSRFGKYIEIPMSNSVIAADLPDQDQDEFKEFVLEINMEMSDDEILNKLIYYADNQYLLDELKRKGLEWCKNFTQQNYATRFIKILDDFFDNKYTNNLIETKKKYNKIFKNINSESFKNIKPTKKIYIQSPNENWCIDVLKKEFINYTSLKITDNYNEASVIWILADYRYNSIPYKTLEDKFVITTIHHIDESKINNSTKLHYAKVNHFTNLFHSICEKTTKSIKKYISSKKKIIEKPFWIDNNIFFKFTQVNKKNTLRELYQIPINSYLIGSFQRDTEGNSISSKKYKPKLSKGPDILIEILKIIKDYSFDTKKIFVLLTGYRRHWIIQKLKKNNIRYLYLENVSSDIMNKLYNILDLYIISSRVEGGPRSLLECCLTKTPIISTDVGLVKKILKKKSIYTNKNLTKIFKNIKYSQLNSTLDENYDSSKKYTITNSIKFFDNFLSIYM